MIDQSFSDECQPVNDQTFSDNPVELHQSVHGQYLLPQPLPGASQLGTDQPSLSQPKKQDADVLECIEYDLVNYQCEGNVMLLGDFNARTGCLMDYVEGDNSHVNPINIDDICSDDTCDISLLDRFNMDKTICEYGRNLIDLCKKAHMRILNGRVIGDLQGNFTCHHYNGSSCVDYGIVDSKIFDQIQYFKVSNHLDIISDHCMISLLLKADFIPDSVDNSESLHSLPVKYLWDENSSVKFTSALKNKDISCMIHDFELVDLYNGDINDHVKHLYSIYIKPQIYL